MRTASVCDSLIEDSTMPMILLGNHAHGRFRHHELYRASPDLDNRKCAAKCNSSFMNLEFPRLTVTGPFTPASTTSSSSSTLLPESTSPFIRRNPFLSLRKTWASAVSNFVSAFQHRNDNRHDNERANPSPYLSPPSLPPAAVAGSATNTSSGTFLASHATSPWSKSEIFVKTQIDVCLGGENDEDGFGRGGGGGGGFDEGYYSRCSSMTTLAAAGESRFGMMGRPSSPRGPPRRLRALTTPRVSPFRKSMIFEEVVAV